jgi:DNA-directed RNA polymerase subunit RPC12/RpoP
MAKAKTKRGRVTPRKSLPRFHVQLRVIPEPRAGTRTVFVATDDVDESFVFFGGDTTGLTFVCGHCGRPLMHGVARGQIVGLVMKCPRCGEFNETLD